MLKSWKLGYERSWKVIDRNESVSSVVGRNGVSIFDDEGS